MTDEEPVREILVDVRSLLVDMASRGDDNECLFYEGCTEHKDTRSKLKAVDIRVDRTQKTLMWGFGIFVSIVIVVSSLGIASVREKLGTQDIHIDYIGKRVDNTKEILTRISVDQGIMKQKVVDLGIKISQQNKGMIYFKDSQREALDRLETRVRANEQKGTR